MRVLVVSTIFPFPPRSGFEVRVVELLRQLARRHDVTLLAYASGDAADADVGADVTVVAVPHEQRSRRRKRALQVGAVLAGRSYHSTLYRGGALQTALDARLAESPFDVIQLESSLLCALRLPRSARIVLDEHNIEHEVFARMRRGERSLARRFFYFFEEQRFRRFEERAWRGVDACVVTSERDRDAIEARAPATRTAVVANGVDIQSFRPGFADPVPRTLVFNGVLDYRPNLDAALFLVDEIFPRLQQRFPEARLTIVGRGDPRDLARLRHPGVSTTGGVPDVRPYLAGAAVATVPIRMGGGTRLKVVEALAMARPTVSTSIGCEGLDVEHGTHLLVADSAEAFADAVAELFEDEARARELGAAGRALVERAYSWDKAGAALESLYAHLDPDPRT